MPLIKVQSSVPSSEKSIEIKNVGSMSPAPTQAMSQDFCQQVNQTLGVSPNRIYIEFADAKGSMWGWNGSTFG